jgi:hypothetical protein
MSYFDRDDVFGNLADSKPQPILDVGEPEPDTTSEFYRLHTPEAAARLEKRFMTHGIVDDEEPPARTFSKRASGKRRVSRELYEEIDPRLRRLMEENNLGYEKIGEIAKEMAGEIAKEMAKEEL